MSAKTYVGVSVSGDNTVYPSRKYLYYPLDKEAGVEYRSRLGYPKHGSGPWLVAWPHVDYATPSTEDVGGSVNSVRIGGRIYGRGAYRTSFTECVGFRYTTYGGYSLYLTIDHPMYAEKVGKNYRYYRHRTEYRMTGRPKWLVTNWSVDENGYPIGQSMIDVAFAHLSEFDLYLDNAVTYDTATWYKITPLLFDPEPSLRGLLYDTEMYLLTGVLPGPWARGFETAYVEAAKSLPQAATNVAANVLEAASLLKSLFTGEWMALIPRSLKQAWLSYRYVYTTTKLDVREFKSTFSRLDSLMEHNSVRTYGSYVRGDVRYSVGFEVDTSQIIPSGVSDTLQRFGLELNALNVWDLVPFSFVVDWFLPVSDVLEYFQNLDACQLEPKDIWWSMETSIDGWDVYVRLPGRRLSTLPYLQVGNASSRTILMRIGDAIALFT